MPRGSRSPSQPYQQESDNDDRAETRLDAARPDLEEFPADPAAIPQEGAAALWQDANDAAGKGYRAAMRAARKIARRLTELTGETTPRVSKAAQEAAENTRNWAGPYAENLRTAVREKPNRSILISLGAGALVGALISRL